MSKITASSDFDRVPVEDVPRYVSIFCEQVSQIINKGLNFQDNFGMQIISAVFGSANADGSYSINIGKQATGYIVIGTTVAMSVYDGTSWNSSQSQITLRSSAIGTARLLVF